MPLKWSVLYYDKSGNRISFEGPVHSVGQNALKIINDCTKNVASVW